ncbi:MAG: hypothetical protein RLZ12_539, partial [Bacillota bacterium]
VQYSSPSTLRLESLRLFIYLLNFLLVKLSTITDPAATPIVAELKKILAETETNYEKISQK